MYVVCSVLLFSLSKFIEEYDVVYRIYLLPYLLPMAHVGLMGSVYSTLAMTIERFLAVCHPFLKHRYSFQITSTCRRDLLNSLCFCITLYFFEQKDGISTKKPFNYLIGIKPNCDRYLRISKQLIYECKSAKI